MTSFPCLDPHDLTRYDFFDEVIESSPDKVIIASLGFVLYERAWILAGMEQFLTSLVADETFANKLLNKLMEFNLVVIEHACEKNTDIFRIGDDWAQQQGLIMGPQLWRTFIKPRFKQLCQAIKDKGKYVMLHCCGKVDEIFPDLIECGLDIFNPFQPEVTDIYETKRKYGDKFTFYGGISVQKTLPFGTVQETKDEVNRLIDIVGENGGLVASPAHEIPADAQPQNIAAMIEVLQEQS